MTTSTQDIVRLRPDANRRLTMIGVVLGAGIPLTIALLVVSLAAGSALSFVAFVCAMGIPIGAAVGGRYSGTVRLVSGWRALDVAMVMGGEASMAGPLLFVAGPALAIIGLVLLVPALAVGVFAMFVTTPCALAWVALMRLLPSSIAGDGLRPAGGNERAVILAVVLSVGAAALVIASDLGPTLEGLG